MDNYVLAAKTAIECAIRSAAKLKSPETFEQRKQLLWHLGIALAELGAIAEITESSKTLLIE